MKEIRAKAGAPIWRRDEETGQTYTLKLTAVGVKAIAVDETRPPKERRNSAQTIRSARSIQSPAVQTHQHRQAKQRGSNPNVSAQRNQDLRDHRLLQRGDGELLAELVATRAGCRTRRGPRSPACASAATRRD